MRIEEAWARLHAAADLAAARGSLLFHLDLAIEVARRAFATRGIGTESLAAVIDDEGYCVIAFDRGVARRALADARFDATGAALVTPDPGTAPPRALTLADARDTIAANHASRAAIVIPTNEPRAPLEGYALAVGDDPETVHLAGHELLTLDPRGRRITAHQPLAAATGSAICSIRALRDTLLVDPGATPNELHVYLSLKHDVPLRVETRESGAHWRVDGARVTVAR